MNEFKNKINELIDKVTAEEFENISSAASLIYNALEQDNILHVFATGHSHMFAEELFYRSGGLVPVNPILVPALMQHEGAIRSTKLERLSGLALPIYEGTNISKGDVFIIVSNSGINSVPVEMAEIVKANNHPLIVITSVEASKSSVSRTNSGKKLYELADIVIDNHAPKGDGIMMIDDIQTGSVSSIVGSFIAQSLVIEIVKLYKKNNKVPPVYKSANTLGGDEHNQKLYQKYKNKINGLF